LVTNLVTGLVAADLAEQHAMNHKAD